MVISEKHKKLLHSALGIEIVRFILVGIVNTIFGYLVFSFLILLGLDYRLALTIGMIIGVIFNFCTSGRYVFRNTKTHLIGRFALVYVVVLALNLGLMWVFVNKIPLGPTAAKLLWEPGQELITEKKLTSLIGQAICLPFLVTTAYLLQKYFVFRKKSCATINSNDN